LIVPERRGSMYDFTIHLDTGSSTPLYEQLYDYIRQEIVTGNIIEGCKLPSTRHISIHLGISRNTVLTCYAQLEAEGYIESVARSGYYVARGLKSLLLSFVDDYKTELESTSLEISHSPSNTNGIIKYDFNYSKINQGIFPLQTWRKMINKCLADNASSMFDYSNKKGNVGLRKEIAKYIYRARGVRCNFEQIILTSGTQIAIDQICKILKGENDSISVEDPGYIGAQEIIRLNDMKVNYVSLDSHGVKLESLKTTDSRIVLVSPSHQFPLGMIMPIFRRKELLKWAFENDGYIIENDYEGEFSYSGKPIPALQSLDLNNRVIYIYNFSSSLLPSVRISFYILPYQLVDAYEKKLSILEQTIPYLEQRALEYFISEGHWERHIRRIKRSYMRKSEILRTCIKKRLDGKVEIIGNSAGAYILLKFGSTLTEQQVIARCLDEGVVVYPTSKFWSHEHVPDKITLIIGFSSIEEEIISDGSNLLADVLLKCLK
jgi:GntR family transcriptional regulator/MocR family aminotransferase